MATGATYVVKYRRRRDNKTDYNGRLNQLKSESTRLIVRPSNKYMTIQLTRYTQEGDIVLCSAKSSELKKLGWQHSTSSIPASYLTGFLCGAKGVKKSVSNAILDTGMNTSVKGSRIYAALKGALDAGLQIPYNESILPTDDRLTGKHISDSMAEDINNIKSKISELIKA